jgi:glyoxylase-like metal-dependent hydrolase (beta-lactamase superfamily II)
MIRGTPIGACVLLALLATPAVAQQDVMVMRAERLSPGLAVISGFANGNILVLTGPDGTLLVDAQSARRVGLADSVLASLGAPPVRWVINTHYHADHTEGNALFRNRGAEIIGQEQLPVQMAKATAIAAWGDWHRTPADPASMPARTFHDTLSLNVNGQRVLVTHIPSAHTDGDAIVWLPDANVMHIGDLFEHLAPPFMDWWAGGRLAGMLAGVDWGLAHSDSATRIVPGHGPVGSRAELLAYREMLLGVSRGVAAEVQAGATLEDAQASRPANAWQRHLGSQRHMDQFVALLYLGLSEFESAGFKARLAEGTAEAALPWLIGCWSTTRNGATIEEQWTAQRDGSLAGTGRTIRNGRVVSAEVIHIAGRGDSLRFTADPSGQAVATFPVSQVTDSSVTFANPAHDFPTRLVYRRSGDAGLHAEIAGPGTGGERVISFPYAAAVCGGG